MITANQKHELKAEVARLNYSLTTMLKKYGHEGKIIPVQTFHPIYKDDYFKELLAKHKMLFQVLHILNLYCEEGFLLLPLNF